MSKHTSKLTISHRLRRGLAGILSLALLLGLLPAAIVPTQAADHWATPYVQTLTDWGVMRGDISGNKAPERTITRAEFVTMMNRAYGYTRTAGHPFTDVRSRDWYSDDIDIAYNMGYFKGTSPTTASPNDPLTREQAAVLLARNMMLQPTVGESLGFSDSRTLSEWSRGLVGAAAGNGILGGYDDGSFKPQSNITRGEVAAMLVRAIGTPIQSEGDHTLGNVYGNVTVNTSGVKLRDGVITGNLYLTGGIDLGDVLMENVNVLGEIIVSGAGESNSSQSSIVLRNVSASAMSVDSISNQFVTIRAEGNTDIKTTTVRTNAYVDDSSLAGYGLWQIIQDGGSLLQLAGNVKEVINKTPDSQLQVVQGVADKITIDEKATGSSVLVDGDARVGELDLDVATKVTGSGDITSLNVGSAGSSVEQLPDKITIRPGITADVNGSDMNSVQAAESSSQPMLLAGYPRAKDISPTSATLVFSVNKPGTIYWAISAVADGSVSEADLIENPSYGGKILKSGTIKATAANTEYTTSVTGLSQDGSYYITAVLVDGREKHSPVKVAAFTTPDGTVPAFIGNPTATLRSVKTAQVTGVPNKSCQLYWALLPAGAAAPTAADFKANAITGNLGYGSMDVTKNVSQSVNVNRGNLREKTNYVAYLWLTDYDGAKSSQVYRVPIYIPDETPPEVHDVHQTGSDASAVEVSFTMNETGKLHWAIVTDEIHEKALFLEYDGLLPVGDDPDHLLFGTANSPDEKALLDAKIKVMAGTGSGDKAVIVSGSTNVPTADSTTRVLMSAARGLDPKVYNTSNFVIYYVGEDAEGNLTDDVGFLEVTVADRDAPVLVEQHFTSFGGSDRVHPLADTSIQLIFSESIQHTSNTRDKMNQFLRLYDEVLAAKDADAASRARRALAEALGDCIELYLGDSAETVGSDVLDLGYAQVTRDNGRMIINLPHNVLDANGSAVTENGQPVHCLNLKSGATYHFELLHIYDLAGNALEASSTSVTPTTVKTSSSGVILVPEFRTASAQVSVVQITQRPSWMAMAQNENGAAMFTSTPLNAAAPTAPASGAINSSPIEGKDIGTNRVSHYVDIYSGYLSSNETAATATTRASNNDPSRVDASFSVNPTTFNVDPNICYDMLIWSNTNIEFTLYSRPRTLAGTATAWSTSNEKSWSENTPLPAAAWTKEGTGQIIGASKSDGTDVFAYTSLYGGIKQTMPDLQMNMVEREYAIHVDKISAGKYGQQDRANEWNEVIKFRITLVTGTENQLNNLRFVPTDSSGNPITYESYYNSLVAAEDGLSPISNPEHREMRVQFNDSITPNIQRVTIENSDTAPKIYVTMDRPGTVYCAAIPLHQVTYKDSAGNATVPLASQSLIDFLSASAGNKVSTFNMGTGEAVTLKDASSLLSDLYKLSPIPFPNDDFPIAPSNTVSIESSSLNRIQLSDPSAVKLTGGGFGADTVKGSGTTPSATTAAEIKFEKPLSANTIYILCVATQGSTTTSLASNAVGFYFITETATRPVITLTGGASSGGGTSTSVKAEVSPAAAVWSILVNETMLNTYNTPMSGQFTLDKVAPEKRSEFINYLKNYKNLTVTESTNPEGTTAYTYSYTILDALVDRCMTDSKNGSVFDNFASTTLQEDVRNYVEESSEGGAVVGTWNSRSQTIAANQSTTMDFQRSSMIQDEDLLICIAIARTEPTNAQALHGFRAYRPVEIQDDQPPKIVNVDKSGLKYLGGGIYGTVTITYDKTLYVIEDNKRYYLAQNQTEGVIKQNNQETEYCGLGGRFTGSSAGNFTFEGSRLAPQSSFTITVQWINQNEISISTPTGLCNRWLIRTPQDSVRITHVDAVYDEEGNLITPEDFVIAVPDSLKSPNYHD